MNSKALSFSALLLFIYEDEKYLQVVAVQSYALLLGLIYNNIAYNNVTDEKMCFFTKKTQVVVRKIHYNTAEINIQCKTALYFYVIL